MRAFVAIELPADVRAALGALSERLQRSGAKASWVRPERMHLTLRFLGEIDEATTSGYAAALSEQVPACGPVRLAVAKTGVFPNLRRPNVIWAGVEAVEGGLEALREAAEQAARKTGLGADNKRFHPHITLARIRDRRRLGSIREALAAETDFAAGAFDAGRLVLFESRLTPKGPEYHLIEEFVLS